MGKQLRNASYKVKRSEMFKVPSSLIVSDKPEASSKDHDQDEIIDTPDTDDITEQATSQVPSNINSPNQPQDTFPSNQPDVNVSHPHSSADLIEYVQKYNPHRSSAVACSIRIDHLIKLSMKWDKAKSNK